MPFPLAAALPAIGTVIGAGIGAWGQSEANEANAEQARLNREFQERMRNTEFQARVKDLQAAGLNPALAYEKGGASSPSGSMPAPMQNAFANMSSSATQALQLVNETMRTNADVENTRMQTIATQIQAAMMNMQLPYVGPKAQGESAKAQSDAQIAAIMEEFNRKGLANLLKKLMGEADLAANNSALAATQKRLLDLQMNKADLFNKSWGVGNYIFDWLSRMGSTAVDRAR